MSGRCRHLGLLIVFAAAMSRLPVARCEDAAFDGKRFPALADGDGGRIALTAEQIATIREAREAVKKLIESPHEPSWIRREAVSALQRLHEGLNDWGREDQLEWYIERLLEEPDPRVRKALIGGAMSAAKARRPHLGGARALWRKLDALAAERPGLLAKDVDYDRRYLADTEGELQRISGLVPHQPDPYRLPAPELDVSTGLKPLPEPNKKGK